MVYCRFHKGPPLVSVLSQMQLLQIILFFFFKINVYIDVVIGLGQHNSVGGN